MGLRVFLSLVLASTLAALGGSAVLAATGILGGAIQDDRHLSLQSLDVPREPGSTLQEQVSVSDDDRPILLRYGGAVTGVDLAASTFTLRTRGGRTETLVVDESTRYLGAITGLSDLQPGIRLGVGALPRSGDSPLAVIVVVPERLQRIRRLGRITASDHPAGEFRLLTRVGEELTLVVDGSTRIRERNGDRLGFEELDPGMVAGVQASIEPGGSYRAIAVVAGTPSSPEYAFTVRGELVTADEGSLTIQTAQGEPRTFQVDGETLYLDPVGRLTGRTAVETGSRVGILGVAMDEGRILARLVFLRPPLAP